MNENPPNPSETGTRTSARSRSCTLFMPVEKFLNEFKRRGCNFDVIFFRDLEDICVPRKAIGWTKAAKFYLTRRVLIRHLVESNLDFQVIEFDSFDSGECNTYQSSQAVHFILCDDDRGGGPEEAICLQHLSRKAISSGKHAALINSISWRSSKIFMPPLSGTKGTLPELSVDVYNLAMKELPSLSQNVFSKTTQPPLRDVGFHFREKYTVAFCRAYIGNYCPGSAFLRAELDRVKALLLQAAALSICSLQDRASVEIPAGHEAFESQDQEFLHIFYKATRGLLEIPSITNEKDWWEFYDVVDGRVFQLLLEIVRNNGEVSPKILEHAQTLYTETTRGLNWDAGTPFAKVQPWKDLHLSSEVVKDLTALLFSHPILNDFMKDVKIKETQEAVDPTAELAFEDLKHWHSYKPVINFTGREKIPTWLEKRRQKHMQWRMADVTSYAASLTNSVGKTFHRETIVVNSQSKPRPGVSSKSLQPKGAEGPRQKSGKGGKQSALLEAQKLSDQKAQAKLKDVLSFWHGKCSEFEASGSLIDRCLKALDFQSDRSAGSHVAVRPEAQLYLCHTSMKLWREVRKQAHKNSPKGLYMFSMIWNWLSEIRKSPNCTSKIANSVQDILKALDATEFRLGICEPRRTIPFLVQTELLRDAPKLISDHRLLQLEHEGPTWTGGLTPNPIQECRLPRMLDNFMYEPPEKFAFKGVSAPLRLPVPGLDEGDGTSPDFKFVHPVAALKDRNRSVLDDVSLEARDCFTLWKHMDKTLPPALLSDTARLDPTKVFPEVIEKSYVVEWERDTKTVLKKATEMQNSPLADLQASLNMEKQSDQPTVTAGRHFEKLFPLQKVQTFEQWKKRKESGQSPNQSQPAAEGLSKLDLAREEASIEINAWGSFDPQAPLDQFSFAVFNGISHDRVHEIMSLRLPDLKGQFPISTTLILRLLVLLNGTNNNNFAVDAVDAFLSNNVRSGVFLEESTIPYIPIWPHDTKYEFNAYLYDFFKHRSLKVLVRDNGIKQGDVWFHLKDFWLTLKTIVTSLKGIVITGGEIGLDDLGEDESDVDELEGPFVKGKTKVKIADSWDDDSEESESDSICSSTPNTSETPQSNLGRKDGLMLVLKAFRLLEAEFGEKLYKVGA
ncbi:hypothetical protein F53441_184 [Fusarium austroafricanum]|uniref:DDX60-like winged helix domain-containing protein n=1 Tax=Fusarium austroafricanum TaxID=2364996 RepID=A0A8H4KXR7_9HYPO|nr:hypothetical protein F53441_184 [Fusarium austroafricanum]